MTSSPIAQPGNLSSEPAGRESDGTRGILARVLVVDDEEVIRCLLTDVLSDEGYEVCTAASGEEAVLSLKDRQYDFVVTDLMMPGINGIKVLEAVKELDPDVEVVVMTGYASLATAVDCMKLGAADYLNKPLNIDEIGITLNRLLEKKRLVAEGNRHLRETSLQVIRLLGNIVEVKDPFTLGHSERVACYATELARAMGLDAAQQEKIQIASLLHDIGKLGIEDAILLKPGPLTWEETREMRRHPEIGLILLKPMEFAPEIKDYTYAHHERHDGRGYPRGISGEEIPLGARILIISEVFDALVTERAYKSAWPLAKAAAYIRNSMGSHFHPEVGERFLQLLRERGDHLLQEARRRFEPHVDSAPLGLWSFQESHP